jgi:hypothetical protein
MPTKPTPPPIVIDRVCGATSPALALEGADDVRFSCQRPRAHGGDHRISLEWPSDVEMFPDPPWRGEATP